MRNAIKLGLVGCALLFLLGLGLYIPNMNEVHDWLRSVGRKSHAADEMVVRQRTSSVLPGLDGTVTVRIGDIKRGRTADVDIIGPDSVILATKKGAIVGDQIPFSHDGKQYKVEVIRYVDKIGPGDTARFRVIPMAKVAPPDAKVNNAPPEDQVNEAPSKTLRE